jgi:outer membrane immunogenic protein
MRRFQYALVTAVAAIGFASVASAADMPTTWTGCYIGANGGYAWNNGKSSYQDANGVPGNGATQDPINGLGQRQTVPAPTQTNSGGWIGGGEIGCNWQLDRRVVLGVEADIDAMRASGSAVTVSPAGGYAYIPGAIVSTFSGGGTANEQVSLKWLSTIRARAGLPVLADRGLLFVTGGLAMGGVSSSGSVNLLFGGGQVGWSGSNSSTRTGYSVGGGFEYALTDRWTTKAEYLYYDLGTASHPLNLTSNNSGNHPYPTLGSTLSSIDGSIIRVGLNYHFGGGPTAVKY